MVNVNDIESFNKDQGLRLINMKELILNNHLTSVFSHE